VQQTARKPYENHEEEKTKKKKKQKKEVGDGGRQTFATKLKILETAFVVFSVSLSRARARQWARSLVALFPCLQKFPILSHVDSFP
jgi:hypothetical protein